MVPPSTAVTALPETLPRTSGRAVAYPEPVHLGAAHQYGTTRTPPPRPCSPRTTHPHAHNPARNDAQHLDKLADALRAMGHDPVILRGGMGARDRAAALA